MNWDTETLAYAAGFLDGEGCFSAYEGQGWKVRISCDNASPEPIAWLQRHFGGTATESSRRRRANHRRMHHWAVVGTAAGALCEAIAPYLKQKAPQALLLIGLRQLMTNGGAPIPPDLLAERARLGGLLKEAKQHA